MLKMICYLLGPFIIQNSPSGKSLGANRRGFVAMLEFSSTGTVVINRLARTKNNYLTLL